MREWSQQIKTEIEARRRNSVLHILNVTYDTYHSLRFDQVQVSKPQYV